MAYDTEKKGRAACNAETGQLRKSLAEANGETEAVRTEGIAQVKLWKGRFWISVGVGTVAIFGTIALAH